MADWVTGKVTKVQNWTDALFSLTVHAPVLPFTAGQFTKLGLEIDGERIRMVEADCGDQVCVRRGWASKNGETIVCLPHKLVIEIVAVDGSEFDDLIY